MANKILKKVFLALGSNVGDRGENIKLALVALELWGVKILRSSSIYETEPVGYDDQDWFYNIVVECETALDPADLLKAIHLIEKAQKRDRKIHNGPRTIDIDIIFYGDWVVDKEKLHIPHVRLQDRKFVLVPLNELANDFVHPVFKKTVQELLNDCDDAAIVRPLSV